eukprot:765713-Hanusia_phi.AAC.6
MSLEPAIRPQSECRTVRQITCKRLHSRLVVPEPRDGSLAGAPTLLPLANVFQVDLGDGIPRKVPHESGILLANDSSRRISANGNNRQSTFAPLCHVLLADRAQRPVLSMVGKEARCRNE